jgi:hypothetical protein
MDEPAVQAALALGIIALVLALGTLAYFVASTSSCCQRSRPLYYPPPRVAGVAPITGGRPPMV